MNNRKLLKLFLVGGGLFTTQINVIAQEFMDGNCDALILGDVEYTQNAQPANLTCVKDESKLCCTEVGYLSVIGGQGFFLNELGNDDGRTMYAECAAHVDALALVLSDPGQKSYIQYDEGGERGTLNVCQSACDQVYSACSSASGLLFPSSVQDGTSLCEYMWGGSDHDTPCDDSRYRTSYACERISSINLVSVSNDATPCFSIGTVSESTIAYYSEYGLADNECMDFLLDMVVKFVPWMIAVIVVAAILCCCGFGLIIACACGLISCCCAGGD